MKYIEILFMFFVLIVIVILANVFVSSWLGDNSSFTKLDKKCEIVLPEVTYCKRLGWVPVIMEETQFGTTLVFIESVDNNYGFVSTKEICGN